MAFPIVRPKNGMVEWREEKKKGRLRLRIYSILYGLREEKNRGLTNKCSGRSLEVKLHFQ